MRGHGALSGALAQRCRPCANPREKTRFRVNVVQTEQRISVLPNAVSSLFDFPAIAYLISCLQFRPNVSRIRRLLLTSDHQARTLFTPQEVIRAHGTDLDLVLFV